MSVANGIRWGKGRSSKMAAKVALLASGNDGMMQTALMTPMFASVILAFPGNDQFIYDQVISVTALFMVPAMLLSSWLARHFNKKWLIVIGTTVFMVAGLAAAFSPSLVFLIVVRALLGIGAGLAFPLIPSSIAYLFSDHEKNQMLGWMNATGSALSFILSAAAGLIATVYWRGSFYLYLIFIPVIILQIVCLPDFKPEKREADEVVGAREQPFGWKPWLVALSMLVTMGIMTLVLYRLSPIIEFNGLGSSADSGLSTSIMTICSFFSALLFGSYFSKLGRFTPAISLMMGGFAFILLALAPSIIVIHVGVALYGLALGSLNPFFMSAMSSVTPASKLTFGMTLVCICQIGAQVITPYYMALVAGVGIEGDFGLCICTATILFVGMVGVTVWAAVSRKKACGQKGAQRDGQVERRWSE